MIDRIRQLLAEVHDLVSTVVGYDIGIELALRHLTAAVDSLEAADNPTDVDVEIVFDELATLRNRLDARTTQLPLDQQPLIKNVNHRINIFLFHHRL